ncbi:MAG: M28 family peptidase [Bacteroidota bacterium]
MKRITENTGRIVHVIKTTTAMALLMLAASCTQSGIDNPEITQEELHEHISFLASDSLKGRLPGTEEGRIAAEYIGNELMSFGFEAFEGGAYQEFEVVTAVTAGDCKLAIGDKEAVLSEEFTPFSFSENGEHKGEVVFCGYGFNIDSEELSWNDFSHDLTGKWALVLLGDPEPRNPDSKFIPYAGEKSKVVNAKDHGAAGVLFVSGVGFDKKDALTKMKIDQTGATLGIPVFHIKRSTADQILEGSETAVVASEPTIAALEASINEKLQPESFICKTVVEGVSEVEFTRVNTQNVVVYLEGNDPLLKDEYIMMGGHYDHLGLGGPNTSSRNPDTVAVHYGADDNASGIASIIEIGEWLAAHSDTLKRSVILTAFGAEEIGILGSKHFTSNPPVELDRVKTMINLDMMGRLKASNDLFIGGVGTSVEGEALLGELLGERELNLSFSYNGLGPSDHAAFYIEDIPVLFISTGAHEDYHTPEDVIEKLNFDGMVAISDYVTALALELINAEDPLTFQEAGPKKTVNSNRRSSVKLGIMPNFGQSDVKGLRIDGITSGGSADRAGMLKGDVIVAIEGKPIANIYEYMARMGALKPGMTITVDILRESKKEVVIVQLSNE